MYRAFVRIVGESQLELPEDEFHHLVRVRRARDGEEFVGLDGHGRALLCRLVRRQGWKVEIVRELPPLGESPLQLTLGQALVKKDRFDWVVEKAVELGVSQIVPVLTHRTEVRLDSRRENRKLERWTKIARAALKQSGRAVLPGIQEVTPLETFLEGSRGQPCLILDEEGPAGLADWVARHRECRSCHVLIGPEGGWDRLDRDLWQSQGLQSVRLGERILRAETAPLVILSILQYELGDLGRGSSS